MNPGFRGKSCLARSVQYHAHLPVLLYPIFLREQNTDALNVDKVQRL